MRVGSPLYIAKIFCSLFFYFIKQVSTAPSTMAGRVEWHGTAHLDGRCQPWLLTFFHLEIRLRINQSPHNPFYFAIIMLPTFLLGHKRIYSRQTYQYLLAWSKHLLGSPWYGFCVNPHFRLPLLLEQSDTELLCALSWNERLYSLQVKDNNWYSSCCEDISIVISIAIFTLSINGKSFKMYMSLFSSISCWSLI